MIQFIECLQQADNTLQKTYVQTLLTSFATELLGVHCRQEGAKTLT